MPQRSVATNFTFEQQRQEINLLAADFTTHESTVNTAAPTYLKHDGSNAFTGQTLNVPNAFTINANSGSGTLTISGNLDVTGTTTTVSTANLEVTDKNILIAKGSTSDAQADGAGITIDSATDITFNFVDAKDALVSSIGLEGTTFLKAPYGQFTGSGTPGGGQGVEINAPDTNTGQIISYDRANTAYKQLNIKGSSVGIYGGTTNALVGTFNSTGLDIVGNIDSTIAGADNDFKIETTTSGNPSLNLNASGAGGHQIYYDRSDLSVNFKQAGGSVRLQITAAGHLLPGTDSQYNIGENGTRFANGYFDTLYGDGSNLTGLTPPAITAISNATNNRIITSEGGTTVNAESNLTFDGNGGLDLIGTGSSFIQIKSANNTDGGVYFRTGTTNSGAVSYLHNPTSTNDMMNFRVNGSNRLQIDASGNLFVRSASANYLVMGSSGDSTTGGVTNNMNWIRGNQTNTQYNTAGGVHAWEVSGAQKMELDADGDLELVSKSQCRITLGDAGTPGTNDSNWVRGDGNNIMLNAAANTGAFVTEIAGAARFKVENTSVKLGSHMMSGSTSNVTNEALIIASSSTSGNGYGDNHVVSIGQLNGNWSEGLSGADTSFGMFFSYANGESQAKNIRGGIVYDHKSTEELQIWSSYGTIAFYQELANSGNETPVSCDTKCAEFDANGHFVPGSNGSLDLGTTGKRWRNIYTSDLDLSNEVKGGNEVDGTWGAYTIQEGESDLFLINRRSGKKYKFNLTEVS